MNRNFDHLNYVYEFKGDSDVSIDTSFVENLSLIHISEPRD